MNNGISKVKLGSSPLIAFPVDINSKIKCILYYGEDFDGKGVQSSGWKDYTNRGNWVIYYRMLKLLPVFVPSNADVQKKNRKGASPSPI